MSDPKIVIKNKDGTKKKSLSNLPSVAKKEHVDMSMFQRDHVDHRPLELNWRSKSSFQDQSSDTWRKLGRRSLPFVFSIAGAIVIGVILGFSVLALFSDKRESSDMSIDSHLRFKTDRIVNRDRRGQDIRVGHLPSLDVYLLQAGQFRSKQRALMKVKRLRAQGITTVISHSSPTSVYLAMSVRSNQAKQMVLAYQQKGIGVYISHWRLDGHERRLTTHAVTALRLGNQLVTQLSSQSLQQSRRVQGQSQHIFQKLMKAYHNAAPQLTGSENATMLVMIRSLRQALHATQSSQVQAGLLRYIIAYKQLLIS